MLTSVTLLWVMDQFHNAHALTFYSPSSLLHSYLVWVHVLCTDGHLVTRISWWSDGTQIKTAVASQTRLSTILTCIGPSRPTQPWSKRYKPVTTVKLWDFLILGFVYRNAPQPKATLHALRQLTWPIVVTIRTASTSLTVRRSFRLGMIVSRLRGTSACRLQNTLTSRE